MSYWNEGPMLPSLTVHEQEKPPRSVVYDHTGQPYARPKQPLGFIDPNNLPKSRP